MLTTLKVSKILLLLCLGLSTRASPILTESKTIPSNHQQSASSFHQEYSFSSNPGRGNVDTKLNVQPPLAVDQSLKDAPSVTTTFTDENGHPVTQVKKEIVNNNNGQHVRAVEIEETKQLPNGYVKSFKTEYFSSSATQYQPTAFVQKPLTPLTADNYHASGTSINGEAGRFGQYAQSYQGSSVSGNSDYFGMKSNLRPAIEQSLTNAPAITTVYNDRNVNLVTQVKKETVNNDGGGLNTRVLEMEETQQLPNGGYSKSFKKQYSSSGAIRCQPATCN